MRPSRRERDAIDVVRDGEKRYPTTSGDPYNLGLYLHHLQDHEVVLALRDTATVIYRMTRSREQRMRAAEDDRPRKRERERSASPSREKRGRKPGKAQPCKRCGVHDNSALAEAKGRKPSSAEWRQWRLDNPRHNQASESESEGEDELEEVVVNDMLQSPSHFEVPEMGAARDASQ